MLPVKVCPSKEAAGGKENKDKAVKILITSESIIRKREYFLKYIVAKSAGFCFGVKNAVSLCEAECARGGSVWSVGDITHNERVMESLVSRGLKIAADTGAIDGGTLVIRSHGLPKDEIESARKKGVKIVDGTCPYVLKIHKIVADAYAEGKQVVIAGEAGHPEVRGINGWCGNFAIIVENEGDAAALLGTGNLCVVAQTTFSLEKMLRIRKIIESQGHKTVEFFDTICYTTKGRRDEAVLLAAKCTKMLVLGSRKSSNTVRLFEETKAAGAETFFIESTLDLDNINFVSTDIVGITAGASAPGEYLAEVLKHMKIIDNDVQSEEFLRGIDESFTSYKKGKFVKGEVISIDDSGLHVNIGGKKDGLVLKADVNKDGSFDPSAFKVGQVVEAVINGQKDESGSILLSMKEAADIKEGDKAVEDIRDGGTFEIMIEKDVKGGLTSRIGTYSVFVPASQAAERFVADLKGFVGKKMLVSVISIDDEARKIVASAKKAAVANKAAIEENFWKTINIDQIVKGTVKRATQFGAFVAVNGFDCLAHITDLSWARINKVEDVLKIGSEYDFVVLMIDRDKNRVSLGYKQLLPKPWETASVKYPVDTIVKAKVVRIAPFGAFVELEPGIDALVPMSEISHAWVKNVNEALKVGQEIEGKVIKNDEEGRKITVSIKAIEPAPDVISLQEQIEREIAEDEAEQSKAKAAKAEAGDAAPKAPRAPRPDAKAKFEAREQKAKEAAPAKRAPKKTDRPADDGTVRQWSENTTNNPFADLLKDFQK